MKTYFFTALLMLFLHNILSAQTTNQPISELSKAYLELKENLANDNSDLASKSVDNFIKTLSLVDYKVLSEGNVNILKKEASEIADTRNIDKQRESFKNISENMIAVAKELKNSGGALFVQYCPMADAAWISDSKEIRNPYYGASMLDCGSVREEIK